MAYNYISEIADKLGATEGYSDIERIKNAIDGGGSGGNDSYVRFVKLCPIDYSTYGLFDPSTTEFTRENALSYHDLFGTEDEPKYPYLAVADDRRQYYVLVEDLYGQTDAVSLLYPYYDTDSSEYKLYLHKQLTQNNEYRDEPLIWMMP